MGYWVSMVVTAQYTNIFAAFLFAGVGAYVSEMITRKLNTIEL